MRVRLVSLLTPLGTLHPLTLVNPLVWCVSPGVTSLRGTLPWMAPEIIKAPHTVNEKADIYSFGVIMWELWTGQEPFEGLHLHALLHQMTSPCGLQLAVPGSPEWEGEVPQVLCCVHCVVQINRAICFNLVGV